MRLLAKITFPDLLALIILLGCGFLIFSGIDGEVKTFAGVVITYYFVRSVQIKNTPRK